MGTAGWGAERIRGCAAIQDGNVALSVVCVCAYSQWCWLGVQVTSQLKPVHLSITGAALKDA